MKITRCCVCLCVCVSVSVCLCLCVCVCMSVCLCLYVYFTYCCLALVECPLVHVSPRLSCPLATYWVVTPSTIDPQRRLRESPPCRGVPRAEGQSRSGQSDGGCDIGRRDDDGSEYTGSRMSGRWSEDGLERRGRTGRRTTKILD